METRLIVFLSSCQNKKNQSDLTEWEVLKEVIDSPYDGYSDHSMGIETALLAISRGAKVIEKHITIDRSLEGPDHLASMEPEEFKKFVISLRKTEILLGSKIKKPSASEKKNLRLARKVIVAEKSIKKGEIYSSSNLTLKRAGKGLSPNIWDSLIGKVAIKDFDKNQKYNV